MKEAEASLRRAGEEAERQARALIAEAEAQAEREKAEAHRKTEELRQEKQLAARKEILRLQENAAGREQEAVGAVIRLLGR